MADVHLPRSLVALFPGAPRRIEARGATVADVIADLDARVPGIRNRLLDAGPSIRTHINIFVAGERATPNAAITAHIGTAAIHARCIHFPRNRRAGRSARGRRSSMSSTLD